MTHYYLGASAATQHNLNQVLQADKLTHSTDQNTDADYKGYACVWPSLCKCSGHDSLSGHIIPQEELFSEIPLRSTFEYFDNLRVHYLSVSNNRFTIRAFNTEVSNKCWISTLWYFPSALFMFWGYLIHCCRFEDWTSNQTGLQSEWTSQEEDRRQGQNASLVQTSCCDATLLTRQ